MEQWNAEDIVGTSITVFPRVEGFFEACLDLRFVAVYQQVARGMLTKFWQTKGVLRADNYWRSPDASKYMALLDGLSHSASDRWIISVYECRRYIWVGFVGLVGSSTFSRSMRY